MRDTEGVSTTARFSMADISISDMAKLLAKVQTNQGKDVAEVYKTPNEDHQHEIRTVGTPSETDRIYGSMEETKASIRSNTSSFFDSINHPDSGSSLHIYLA